MREKTQPKEPTCAICHKPITEQQHPSIQMKPGVEVHFECWQKQQSEEKK